MIRLIGDSRITTYRIIKSKIVIEIVANTIELHYKLGFTIRYYQIILGVKQKEVYDSDATVSAYAKRCRFHTRKKEHKIYCINSMVARTDCVITTEQDNYSIQSLISSHQ